MFNFGADYYPEQWPRERWEIDARQMAEAGFNVVRLAEFAWAKLQPTPDRYDLSWLDEAISVLAAHGIRVVLGTPTGSPPAWLMERDPSQYRVREDGVRLGYGHRREYCPNHSGYQAAGQSIVAHMAEHYADNPAVIGWQIDNEFGDRCYCPVCQRRFQEWVCERYRTLDALNERWGTIFWSHVYTDWSQIPVPLIANGSPNPGLALDFYRFASDSYVDFQQQQIDLIRQHCPTHFITHNFMGFGYDKINYFDLAAPLDFVSWDNYRRMQWSNPVLIDPSQAALAHAAMRGLKQQNFWVMEQQSGAGGWEIVSMTPRPGEIRLWAYQSIAHGADGIVFFRWRTARYGTEQYWHGILDHDATPGRRYREVTQLGRELSAFGSHITGSTVAAKVAILLDYDSRFAFQVQQNNLNLSYPQAIQTWYKALHRLNVAADVVAPDTDLSSYALVVAPLLHVVTPPMAAHLTRYVEAGGTLIVGPRAGVKDQDNTVIDQRLPGLLAELCGVIVEDYDSPTKEVSPSIRFEADFDHTERSIATSAWSDILAPTTARVLARYEQEYYAGQAAITSNRFGDGRAIYVGTVGGDALADILVQGLLPISSLDQASVSAEPGLVEIVQRWRGETPIWFCLNHSGQPQQITVRGHLENWFDGTVYHDQTVSIPKYDLLILSSTYPAKE